MDGKALLAGKETFPSHPGRAETLDGALLKRILLTLRLSGRVLKATWLKTSSATSQARDGPF